MNSSHQSPPEGFMHLTTKRRVCFAAALVALGGCTLPPPAPTKTGLDRIEHIVVIYAENRSFDNLYGLFPGANGIANATPAVNVSAFS